MFSEDVYNNLMENIYVMGNQANYEWLMESKAQLEGGKIVDFTKRFYRVNRIDGDYAFLLQEDAKDAEEKCVARALLPPEISEGSRLAYECMQYELM